MGIAGIGIFANGRAKAGTGMPVSITRHQGKSCELAFWLIVAWFTYNTLHAAVHALACMGACMDDACTARGRCMDGCVDGAWTARVRLRVWPHVCTVAGAIQIHSNTVTQSCI